MYYYLKILFYFLNFKKLVFSSPPQFKQVSAFQLEIGDIILLKKRDFCPVDLVIFDCKDDICFVDTSEIEELTSYSIKKPLEPIKCK